MRESGRILDEVTGSNSVLSRINGLRMPLLLREPDYERACENLEAICSLISPSSLEFAMAVNYTSAVGLSTSSETVHRAVVALLAAAPPVEERYGHQRTVRSLLSVTMQLGLSDAVRRNWIRWALYENAARLD
jgi:hypothetical protein